MKTFVKDFNLNQKELNTTINLLNSMKEAVPTYKRIIKNYGIKNPVKTIVSDLLDYTINSLSEQLKHANNDAIKDIITDELFEKTSSYIKENNDIITKDDNKTNNKIVEKLRNRLLDENIYIVAQGDTFRVSKLLKDNNEKNISIIDFINAEFKRRQSDNKKDNSSEPEWVGY